MNKLMKKIVTGVLALTMVMGTVVFVSAAEPVAVPVVIQKKLESPLGVALAAQTFEFTITPVGIATDNVNPGTTKATIDTTKASTMPELGTKAPFAKGDVGVAEIATVAITGGETGDVDSGTGYITKTVTSADLTAAISATNPWPHAGVFVYDVEETTGLVSTIDYSDAKYQLIVYVENNNAMTGLIASTVIIRKTLNDAGTTDGLVPTVADDDTGLTGEKVLNALFTNRNEVLVPLTASKLVAGSYADTTKQFTFTPVFTKPLGMVSTNTYKGVVYKADGTRDLTRTVTVTLGAAGTTAVTANPTTFTLAHGEDLKFEDLTPGVADADGITGLPAGVTYTLTEAAAPQYIAVAKFYNNDTTEKTENGSVNTALKIPDTATGVITLGDVKNESIWTNTREVVTPTGILLNNLPFILLIVVSIGGFVGYIAHKRRKATN